MWSSQETAKVPATESHRAQEAGAGTLVSATSLGETSDSDLSDSFSKKDSFTLPCSLLVQKLLEQKGPAQGDDSESIHVMPFCHLGSFCQEARPEAVPVHPQACAPPGLCSPPPSRLRGTQDGEGSCSWKSAHHTGLLFLCCCLDC